VRISRYYQLPALSDYALAGLKLLIVAAFIVLAWGLINRITKFDDHHALFEERNTAYALQRGGMVLGQAIALTSLIEVKDDAWTDLAWLLCGGIWITALLLGVRALLPVLVPFAPATDGRTVSVGLVHGSFLTASGLVIGAGLTGFAPTLATAIAATVVFTLLGLGVLAAAYLGNGVVRPYRLAARVREGNLSAGLISGGFLIALGLVLHNAIAGEFTGWISGLIGFAVTALIALAVFYLLCVAVDRWVIENATLVDVVDGDHVHAAAIVAVALVAIAIAVSAIVI
jgi:uncharacterized membrane protein YjfL (UPF0719 family)